MSSSANWPLAQTPVNSTTPQTGVSNVASDQGITIFGKGLIRPFQRNGRGDYNTATGVALVRSYIVQILGTQATSAEAVGELPYYPEFGSLLHLLRHQNNTVVAQELAKVYIADALRKWAPSLKITRVDVRITTSTRHMDTLSISLYSAVLQASSTTNTSGARGEPVIITVSI